MGCTDSKHPAPRFSANLNAIPTSVVPPITTNSQTAPLPTTAPVGTPLAASVAPSQLPVTNPPLVTQSLPVGASVPTVVPRPQPINAASVLPILQDAAPAPVLEGPLLNNNASLPTVAAAGGLLMTSPSPIVNSTVNEGPMAHSTGAKRDTFENVTHKVQSKLGLNKDTVIGSRFEELNVQNPLIVPVPQVAPNTIIENMSLGKSLGQAHGKPETLTFDMDQGTYHPSPKLYTFAYGGTSPVVSYGSEARAY